LFAAALAVLTHVPACVAQADRPGRFEHGFADYPPWELPSRATRADSDALNARWRALAEELKTASSASAGTYEQRGAMRSGYLRWAPGAGFVYLYVYEIFAVIEFSYGTVEVTPAEIIFKVERESLAGDGPRLGPIPRRWVAARWKRAEYLVPAEQMSDFGNYVAGLGQYNDFNGPCCEFEPFFVKQEGVEQGMSHEQPDVPQNYRRFMRRPVEATIKSVGRKRAVREYGLEGTLYSSSLGPVTLTPVRIDLRRRRGLRPGLLFRLAGAPLGQYLKITRVGLNHSGGVVIRSVNDAGKETCHVPDSLEFVVCPPVAVGARVTTSPP
jgi:hypothetical protein